MISLFRIGIVCCLLGGSLSAEIIPVEGSLFKDPEFQKAFVGSYGFMSEVEPKLDPTNEVEKKLMQDVGALLAQNNLPQARALLTPVVTEDTNAAFQFALATIYFQEGNNEMAEKWYLGAIKKLPSFLRAYKNLGLVRYQKGNQNAEAIAALAKAVELGDRSAQTFGLLGVLYLGTGDLLAAESALRHALILNPTKTEWKKGLLKVYIDSERYSEANALADQLILADPDNGDFWTAKGAALTSLNRLEEASKAFETLRFMGKASPKILEILGNLYMDAQNPNAALSAYQAAMAGSAKLSGASSLRTANLLYSYQYTDQAEKFVSQLKQRLGELTDSEQLDLRTLEAKIARDHGSDDAAAAILQDIVLKDNRNGEARIELAQYYERKMKGVGDSDEAKRLEYSGKAKLYFDQALMIEESESKAALRYGQMLVGQKEFVNAVPMLKRSLKAAPNDRVEEYLRRVERAAKQQEAKEAETKKNLPVASK